MFLNSSGVGPRKITLPLRVIVPPMAVIASLVSIIFFAVKVPPRRLTVGVLVPYRQISASVACLPTKVPPLMVSV